MPKTAKGLLEKRATIITNARKLVDEHGDDQGNLSAEHQQTYDKMLDDADKLHASAKGLQRLESAEAGMNEPNNDPLPKDHPMEDPGKDRRGNGDQMDRYAVRSYGRNADGSGQYSNVDPGKRGGKQYREAFSRYLARGQNGMQPEQLAALQSDNAEAAGYLVPSEQFAAGLLKEVDDLLFVRRYARVHTVREADSLGIRKRTSKVNTFGYTTELTISDEDNSLKYGKKILTPHPLTGLIKYSRDLARRAIMPVDQIVIEEMAIDAAEVQEDMFLYGDGNQKPLGVFVNHKDGITADRDVLTGSNNNFTADGLINAKYSLKAQYRNGTRGAIRWMFHREAIRELAKLKDGEGQYLLRIGLGRQQDNTMPEDSLLGIAVDESERAPNTFAQGNYGGLLANWRYYEIADALDMELQVLMEKFSLTNQIGVIGRLKNDGAPTLEEAFVRLTFGT